MCEGVDIDIQWYLFALAVGLALMAFADAVAAPVSCQLVVGPQDHSMPGCLARLPSSGLQVGFDQVDA